MKASEYQLAQQSYVSDGMARALALGNRGPLRFDQQGRVHEEILEAYWRTGCYVFENVIDPAEIKLLQTEIESLLARAPVDNGASEDAQGRPAFGQEFARPIYSLIPPLTDPWGGTDKLNGRHPTKMTQPESASSAPKKVVFLMSGMCQIMDAGLRLYGNPDLLKIAASINGDDLSRITMRFLSNSLD